MLVDGVRNLLARFYLTKHPNDLFL